MNKYIVSFDTETTGLGPTHRVLQIAINKYEIIENKIYLIESYQTLINPGIEIDPRAEAVHHIGYEQIKDQPTFGEVFEKIESMFSGSDLHGYNITGFDIKMMQREYDAIGKVFDVNKTIYDSLVLAKREKLKGNKLCDVYYRYFNEDFDGAHDALVDVEASVRVFEHQINLHGIDNCKYFN